MLKPNLFLYKLHVHVSEMLQPIHNKPRKNDVPGVPEMSNIQQITDSYVRV